MDLEKICRKIEELCFGLPSRTEWLFMTSEVSIIAGSYYGEGFITDHPDVQANFIKFCAPRSKSSEAEDVKNTPACQENNCTTDDLEERQNDCSSDNDDWIDLPEKENSQEQEFTSDKINQKPKFSSDDRCNNSTDSKSSKSTSNNAKQNKHQLRSSKSKRKLEKCTNDFQFSSEESQSSLPRKISSNLSTETNQCIATEVDWNDEVNKSDSPCKRTLKRWSQGMKQASPAQQLAAKNRPCKMIEPLIDQDGNQYFECDVCKMHYSSAKETKAHHKKDHVLKRAFPCKECDKVYRTKTPWLHHMTNKHCDNVGRELYNCEKCLSSFPYASSLRAHQVRCKGSAIDIINCNLCGETFVHTVLLQTHVELMHSGIDAKIKCRHCDVWFESEGEMNKHAEKHQSSSYQCQICKKCFTSDDELIQHGNCIKRIKSLSLKCELCGRKFRKLTIYKRHMLLHVKTNVKEKFECEICQQECANEMSYKRHRLVHVSNAEKPFHCEQCGQGFITKYNLKLHMKNHRENKHDYMCDTCGKAFKFKSQLINHIRRKHTGEKPFSCEVCQQTFYNGFGLKNHKDRYHSSNVHVCEICGQNYKTKRSLYCHLYSHKKKSERKKVQCDKCSQVLSSHKHYLIHYGRTHLTVDEISSFPLKTYKCEVCNKICMCKWKLKVHMRIHTGEKPNKCRYCGKGFAERCNMLVHEKGHTDTERYGCFCGKMYSNARGLRIHQKNCSSVQEENAMTSSLDTASKEPICMTTKLKNPSVEGLTSGVVSADIPQTGSGNVEGVVIDYSTLQQNWPQGQLNKTQNDD